MNKTCSRCNQTKSVLEFGTSNGKRNNWCKACFASYRRAERDRRNREINERRRQNYLSSEDLRLRKAKANELYRSLGRSKEAVRARNIMQYHGITVEEYDEWMSHPCAICDGLAEHLDHDHDTGRIRGALCARCNLMLGHAQDDVDRLRAGAEYLERHRLRVIEGGG